jgi:hypothetical protein
MAANMGWEPDICDRRAPEVEQLAYEMAFDRGGQTIPLSSYDLDIAEEVITGRKNLRAENVRLRRRVAELERALTPPPPKEPRL